MRQRYDYYKLITTDPIKNLRLRVKVLRAAQRDIFIRTALREMCKRDFVFFVNLFIWQYNPLKKDGLEAGPFIMWDCQLRAVLKQPGVPWPGEDEDDLNDCGILESIENGHSLLIEKSRDMGISWLCLLVFLWLFLFYPYQKFLCISRNEAAVEDEDPDSLFWKLDWALRHLPSWLRPEIRRRKRFFGNDSLNSTITGQASTGEAGVGGRATAMLIDEFSAIKEDKEVRQRTASTTNCRIFNGTHRGMDTEFYALSQQPEMPKLRIHWTQHPDKRKGLYRSGIPVEVLDKQFVYQPGFNFVMDGSPVGGARPQLRSPWYDRKCEEIGSSRGVAQELDINPSGSVSQFFDPLVISGLVREYAQNPQWEGDISADGRNLVHEAGGRIKLWIFPDASGHPPKARYGAGADISMGTGASPSCLSIGNAETGEKVLECQDPRMSPDEWAVFCFRVLSLFVDDEGQLPLLGWEHKGPGALFTKKLKATGYRRFYYRENELDITGAPVPATEPGWDPKPANKLLLLEEYRQALRKRQYLNRSERALMECLSWKYSKNGYPVYGRATESDDPSGARDNHGDQTIADGLSWKMMQIIGVSEQKKVQETIPIGSIAWRKHFHDNLRKLQSSGWVS